ncbi:MAG: type II toxin-antitoxin system VapC family toxin [bacterium]
MKTFFDSSAYAKRYVLERGSDTVDEICQNTDHLALCVICVPEIISALNRKLKEKNLSKHDYSTAKKRLFQEIQDALILNITPTVINKSILILESNQIRAMDSLHIACALEWKAELFVSADTRQIKAAKKSGLTIQSV